MITRLGLLIRHQQLPEEKINGSNNAVENCDIHSARKCYISKIFRNGMRCRRYIQHKIIQQEQRGSNTDGGKQNFKMRNFHCAWRGYYLRVEKKKNLPQHYPTCGRKPP